MDSLIKENWNKDNINDFYKVLESFKRENKIKWTQNIVCTNHDTLAVMSTDSRNIVKQILKGNYLSFLDVMPSKYHESLIICAYLISKIKDYKLQIKYINKIQKYIDSWSIVDTLKFSIKNHEDEYLEYAKRLLISNKPFERRTGVRILFSYVRLEKYHSEIFSLLDSLINEEHYYVNMAAAWLLCEMFIKYPNETFRYLDKHKTNSFIINKGISKCRDSYRVSRENKDKLLKYKMK